MHVGLVIDEDRLAHEHAALNRLIVGLIGEGVQTTRIVPDTLPSHAIDQGEQRVALVSRIETPMIVLPWMRRERTARILEAMEKGRPDVLYAIGERAWPIGLDLAGALECPLALDTWSADQARRVPRGRRATAVAGYLAPTVPIAELLRQRVDPGLVCHVPPGVALPASPRSVLADADSAIGVAIIGQGRDVPAYRTLLGGLARLIDTLPQIQGFLELVGPREHDIWRHAQALELLEHLSTITDASQHRALLTRCDLLLMPEHNGELRTIMLEAMAFGLPVIAAADAYLDMLQDGVSAQLVPDPTEDAWATRIREMLEHPDRARALGDSARTLVAERHRSSDHVDRLVETFERLLSGGTYRIDTRDG